LNMKNVFAAALVAFIAESNAQGCATTAAGCGPKIIDFGRIGVTMPTYARGGVPTQ